MNFDIFKTRHATSIIISIIIFCAALLRFWHLDYKSIWDDEALTTFFTNSAMSFKDVIDYSTGVDRGCIVPNSIAHISSIVIGDSLFAIRLFSALCGIGAVFLIYLLGKRLLGKTGGLVAAALCAVSPFCIYLSQEMRPYGFLFFLSALASYLFLLCKDSFKLPQIIAYALVILTGCYSNPFFVFILIFHFLFVCALLFCKHEPWQKWLLLFAFIGCALIPFVILQISVYESAIKISPFSARAVQNFLGLWFRFGQGYLFQLNTGADISAALTKPAIVAILCLGYAISIVPVLLGILNVKKRSRKTTLFLLGYLVIPILCAFILFPRKMNPRQLSIAAPAFYLLTAAGLTRLPFNKTQKVIVAGYCLFTVFSTSYYYTLTVNPHVRQDFKSLSLYLQQNSSPSDTIQIVNSVDPSGEHARFFYPVAFYNGTYSGIRYYNKVQPLQICTQIDTLWIKDKLTSHEKLFFVTPVSAVPYCEALQSTAESICRNSSFRYSRRLFGTQHLCYTFESRH